MYKTLVFLFFFYTIHPFDNYYIQMNKKQGHTVYCTKQTATPEHLNNMSAFVFPFVFNILGFQDYICIHCILMQVTSYHNE